MKVKPLDTPTSVRDQHSTVWKMEKILSNRFVNSLEKLEMQTRTLLDCVDSGSEMQPWLEHSWDVNSGIASCLQIG